MLLRLLPLAVALACAPAAQAAATSAGSTLSVELLDVLDANGARVETGWFAFGDAVAGQRLSLVLGNASTVDLPAASGFSGELGIGQGITFGVSAGGATFGPGSVEDATDGSLEITFENFSGAPLTFSFRYQLDQFADASLDAPGEQAYAETNASLGDDSGDFLTSRVFSNNGLFNGSGTARFTLANGSSDLLFGNLATSTFAAAPVPEPRTWAFLAAGIGLVAWRARRGANA